ncbi:SHOCT domain-containing protein [Flavobacteriales bacterium]|nr:SHOCT domain-containing protein [Flavobacteriales bacterium]
MKSTYRTFLIYLITVPIAPIIGFVLHLSPLENIAPNGIWAVGAFFWIPLANFITKQYDIKDDSKKLKLVKEEEEKANYDWVCHKCKEPNEEIFDSCWKCNENKSSLSKKYQKKSLPKKKKEKLPPKTESLDDWWRGISDDDKNETTNSSIQKNIEKEVNKATNKIPLKDEDLNTLKHKEEVKEEAKEEAKEEIKEKVKKNTPTNIKTLADNLRELNKLKEDGILTEEEFNEQKKKLLKQ